jgi:hypothetical protein
MIGPVLLLAAFGIMARDLRRPEALALAA